MTLPKEIMDKLPEEAEKAAIAFGFPQSDKESFEATYWTLHNAFADGYKAAALHYSQIIEELKAENKELKISSNWANELRKEIEQLKEENERLKLHVSERQDRLEGVDKRNYELLEFVEAKDETIYKLTTERDAYKEALLEVINIGGTDDEGNNRPKWHRMYVAANKPFQKFTDNNQTNGS